MSNVPTNIDPECAMRGFAPEERFPAVTPVMKITAPAESSWTHHQLAFCANGNTDKIFLIISMTAAETCSLRPTPVACQRGPFPNPLCFLPPILERPQSQAAPLRSSAQRRLPFLPLLYGVFRRRIAEPIYAATQPFLY